MTFLCDTNIISELVRPQPNPGVIAWSQQKGENGEQECLNCPLFPSRFGAGEV
ncbi:PIN domain-containing protein [Tolypothrix campylonemoides]|uniref:hypothetical protein n=1 Tax=Tolypothrix campylonemoides TaxID=1136105 RepID=UPI0038B42EDD